MTIRISTACNEFGQAFTVGQVVNELSPQQQNAMVLSGLANWISGQGIVGDIGLTVVLPEQGAIIPITSVQHANPVQYGLNQYNLRTYQFNNLRVFWNGSGWTNLVN